MSSPGSRFHWSAMSVSGPSSCADRTRSNSVCHGAWGSLNVNHCGVRIGMVGVGDEVVAGGAERAGGVERSAPGEPHVAAGDRRAVAPRRRGVQLECEREGAVVGRDEATYVFFVSSSISRGSTWTSVDHSVHVAFLHDVTGFRHSGHCSTASTSVPLPGPSSALSVALPAAVPPSVAAGSDSSTDVPLHAVSISVVAKAAAAQRRRVACRGIAALARLTSRVGRSSAKVAVMAEKYAVLTAEGGRWASVRAGAAPFPPSLRNFAACGGISAQSRGEPG